MIVHPDDFLSRSHLVEEQWDLRIVWNSAAGVVHRRAVDVGFLQTLAQRDPIAQRWNATHGRAVTEGNQHVTVRPEVAQHAHVLFVGTTAFDEADGATTGELFDVIDR